MDAVEQDLDAALAGITAPVSLAPAVLRTVRERRLSRLPEILDSIGWVAILIIALVVVAPFAPSIDATAWAWIFAAAVAGPALWFGWRTAREWNG